MALYSATLSSERPFAHVRMLSIAVARCVEEAVVAAA